MKLRILSLGLVFALIALMIPCTAFAQEEAPSTTLLFGGRMQNDQLFYLQGGVLVDTWEFMGGLGLNNAIWIGAHKYLGIGTLISGFTGLELHITYPNNDTITFKPAWAIGLAFDVTEAIFVIESLILPSMNGEPVGVLFAVSFLFKL